MIIKDQNKALDIHFSVAIIAENSVILESETFSFSAFSRIQLTSRQNGNQLSINWFSKAAVAVQFHTSTVAVVICWPVSIANQ